MYSATQAIPRILNCELLNLRGEYATALITRRPCRLKLPLTNLFFSNGPKNIGLQKRNFASQVQLEKPPKDGMYFCCITAAEDHTECESKQYQRHFTANLQHILEKVKQYAPPCSKKYQR